MTKLQRVLVVDASKLVRASLAKYLKGHFEIVEDPDGESAWQTLVLDSSIVAVVSGCGRSALDGVGLVERMRENRLCRLNSLPFFLLVSDSFSDAERQGARLCGVSDFVPKGMAASEVAALIKHFVEQLPLAQNRRPEDAVVPMALGAAPFNSERSLIGATDIMGQVGRLAGLSSVPGDEVMPARKQGEFLDRQGIVLRLQALLPGNVPASPLGLLVFGLDGYASLVERFGQELAQRVAQKISNLLADKIRAEDSIGHLESGRVAIIAPHTNIALCSGFASRVCKALAAAQIALRGQRLGMTVSVGIAALPDDGESMPGLELLAMAVARLDEAMRAGGNRVQAGSATSPVASALPASQNFLQRLRETLASASPETISACLGSAGLQILPLLSLMEKTMQIGLPMAELEQRLTEQAGKEESPS